MTAPNVTPRLVLVTDRIPLRIRMYVWLVTGVWC
ncbi:hypothetical protein LCGC14_0873630 [marine sediment metagenome]|uniref:Uncharacterized protein n=1 Tax=marine sediment metagenome TaxID=412755 RepID=A0A0F9RNJ8_9ZZZZ